LLRYVEHRLRVTLHDGRSIVGTFLAFDKHLNLVLSEAEEFRTIKKSASGSSAILEERTDKRTLGLVLIRGENVVSLAVEGPPPPSGKGATAAAGPGMARGAGRGTTPQHPPTTMIPPPSSYHPGAVPMGLGAAPVYGLGGGAGIPPPPPPPPPPPGIGLPPPGMGRGMPFPPY
jgi:small nuclear ribonucleoprotein B and B'